MINRKDKEIKLLEMYKSVHGFSSEAEYWMIVQKVWAMNTDELERWYKHYVSRGK